MSTSVLITGASSGIGRAVALELARRGYRLALTARRGELLEELRGTILDARPGAEVVVRVLDVTDHAAVFDTMADVVEEMGGLDVVIANAGVAADERVGRGAFAGAARTVEVNLTGAMATMDAAVRHFLTAGAGHVVAISSVAAFRGLPGSSAYCASKAGLAVYTEAMRAELYRDNIDVTVLYPGFIDTPINETLPRRPFLIDAETGARKIVRLIERRVRASTVPMFPWSILSRLLRRLPLGVVSRVGNR